MKNNKGTICVQGGWKPKKGEPRVYLFIRVLLLNMILQIRWEDFLI